MVEVLLLVGFVVAAFVGYNIGGATTAPAFGPAVGSGVLSMAGAAALLVSRALRHAIALGASEIRYLLVRTARPWRTDAGEGVGVGTLDVGAALAALDRRLATSTDFEPAALEA
jgi:hypothetical protein